MSLSKTDRDYIRLRKLNERWLKAQNNSKYYQRIKKKHNLPETFSSIEEYISLMPITTKNAVSRHPKHFLLNGHARGKWMSTGGSTGIPTRVYWKLKGHLESLRDQYWARMWWGVDPFDKQAMIWGHSHTFGHGMIGTYHRLMVPITDKARRRMRLSAYQIDESSLRRYYDKIDAFQPASLYAYSSAAFLLAMANSDRPPLGKTLKAAFLAAEPILPQHRKIIDQILRCPAVGEYGSIECGMIAYEHPSGGYHIFENSVLVDTSKNPSGGYDLIVTQLRDSHFPLFRYQIGDMTAKEIERGNNGREILGEIKGRTHDFLRTPSGRFCHGEMITHCIEQLSDILIFNVHQRRDFRIIITITTNDSKPLSLKKENWLKTSIRTALCESISIDLDYKPELSRSIAGKHRWITTEFEQ